MSRSRFFLIFICCVPFSIMGQSITYLFDEGGTSGSGDGYSGYTEDARGICIDGSGNMYVTGAFYGTATFSGNVVSSSGETGYLIKYNSAGSFQWIRIMEGSAALRPRSISITGTGGSATIYISGTIRGGTGTFGALTITCAGSDDVFIAKYDANGNEQWAQNMGGTSSDYQEYQACVSDAVGNVYVTGVFGGTISFGAPTTHSLTSAGAGDAFLVKYNSAGDVQWVLGGHNATGYAQGYAIAISPAEDYVYVTGYYSSATLSWGSYSQTVSGVSATYLVCVDSSGTAQWLRKGYSSGYTIATSIDVDDDGNIYLSGFTTYSAYFGSAPWTGITVSGNRDIFLVKYNTAGTKQWAVNAIKGTKSKTVGGIGVSAPSGTGNIIITGSFNYTASFGGTIPLTAEGGATNNTDMYVASYNTYNGAVNWAIQGGSTLNTEMGYDVIAMPTWDAYVVGVFAGTATFGGTDVVSSAGGTDVYIGKMALNYLPISLLDFDAKPNDAGDRVDLSWTTATETNNHYFTVERSADGENFIPILTKNGAGNSSMEIYYTDADEAPLPGTSYYRLKQTDYDGKFTYSKSVAVFIDNRKRFSFAIYPNPFHSSGGTGLRISELPEGIYTLFITNNLGQVVHMNKINSSDIIELSTGFEAAASGLPPGNYSITIQNVGYSYTEKLIVL